MGRSKKKSRSSDVDDSLGGESGSNAGDDPNVRRAAHRSAEAATVAWMLATLATLVAELLTLASAIAVSMLPAKEESPGLLGMIPGSLGFTALVTGAAALALTPVVRRLRVDPPPGSIVVAAVVVGALPWLLLVVSMLAKLAG